MKVLDDKNLNMMWNVATSSSLESGTPPHEIFARLLYNRIVKEAPKVEVYENTSLQ